MKKKTGKKQIKRKFNRQDATLLTALLVFVCLLVVFVAAIVKNDSGFKVIENAGNTNTNINKENNQGSSNSSLNGSSNNSNNINSNSDNTNTQVNDNTLFEEAFFSMDTYMSIKCYGANGEEGAKKARSEVEKLDVLLTAVGEEGAGVQGSYETSEILRLNRDGSAIVGEDVLSMLETAQRVSERTNGLYDLTVYPLIDLWGFTSRKYHIPSEAEIEEVLKKVDYRGIKTENNKVSLNNGQTLGLGSIAKGYTSGKCAKIIEASGVKSAILSLGGNIQCIGTRPNGSLWRVGVKDPKNSETNLIGVLSVKDVAVITSGSYERYFKDEDTGRIYHHIIDPSNGYPTDNGLLSVTIVSKNAALADALSTACFVLGKENAINYWKNYGNLSGEEFEMIMINETEIIATEGLKDSFECQEKVSFISR
ncbi:MAG: FAD:protein FMN transferase [Lachnospiraceae bacterium]|nr:FAD:protein FMN transferase [Lachnospiraceae bacterium]